MIDLTSLIIGVFIGANVGFVVAGILFSAHRSGPGDAVGKGEAYPTDDWSFPGHGIRIVEVAPVTADSIDAAVRGD